MFFRRSRVCHFFHSNDGSFQLDVHHLPMPSHCFFMKASDEAHHGHHNKTKQDHYFGQAADQALLQQNQQKTEPTTEPTTQTSSSGNHTAHHHLAPPTHKEFSLFQKGIFPDWEDEHCREGGCWYFRQYLPPAYLDAYWTCLVQACVNTTTTTNHGKDKDNTATTTLLLLDSSHIAGIRIDDKSKSVHPMYKLEIWVTTRNADIRNKIRDQVHALLEDCNQQLLQSTTTTKRHINKVKLHWRDFHVKDRPPTTSSSVSSSSLSMTNSSRSSSPSNK